MTKKDKVFFVYLGNTIPEYANASLKLATQTSGLEVIFVGNHILSNQVLKNNITFISLEDFYCTGEFQEVKRFITYSHDFRGNFWLKTLERFFVLEQLMPYLDSEYFFHAELDQLLFNCDKLIRNLNSSGLEGLFVPFHSDTRAVASILYCNNYLALSSLINFARSGISFENEMELIALWTHQESKFAHILPTLATELKSTFFSEHFATKVLGTDQTGGIVDAAQLGQWVSGIDPRNLPISRLPLTRFIDLGSPFLLSEADLESLNFNFDNRGNFLMSNNENTFDYQLYNLHIHAKIHKWFLRFNAPKKRILFLSNRSKKYLVLDSKYYQLKWFFSEIFSSATKNPKLFFVNLFRFFFK